jgi:hypothetical protein
LSNKIERKPKLHPLLSKGLDEHYYNKDGRNYIYDYEKDLTVVEMIGACKFNIHKYNKRDKKQDEIDNHKSLKYQDYMTELMKIPKRLEKLTVRRAFSKLNIVWDYTR